MYTPSQFRDDDPVRIRALIDDNPFALLVTVIDDKPVMTHAPVLLTADGQSLVTHIARSNPHASALEDHSTIRAVFQGPQGYISPQWYARPGVPTWDYSAVHVTGRAHVWTDLDRLHELVMSMAKRFEARHPPAWNGPYNRALLDHIVGVEISVERLDATFKLSQNRSADERARICENLRRSEHSEGDRLAALIESQQPTNSP